MLVWLVWFAKLGLGLEGGLGNVLEMKGGEGGKEGGYVEVRQCYRSANSGVRRERERDKPAIE